MRSSFRPIRRIPSCPNSLPAYWDTTEEPTKTQYELFLKFDAFGEKEYGEISEAIASPSA